MNNQQDVAADLDDKEIDLKALLLALWDGRKPIIAFTLGVGLLALGVSLALPPVFTATATILPPQQQSSGLSAALGSLGALAGGGGGLKNPNELYVAMMKSQTVSDRLIERFDLKKRLQKESQSAARMALSASVTIAAAKSGLIEISVDDKDPKFAAALANAFVDELKALNQRLAVTDAGKRRLFFEKQLHEVRTDLRNAENRLQQLQQETGLVVPEGQVGVIIKNVAELKAKIAAKEVELSAMRTFATDQNPDYVRAVQALTTMKQQLAGFEENSGGGGLSMGAGNLPKNSLSYIRALREIKYNETLFELLAKQYEVAKVEESKDSSLIQVLDVATVPDHKSKPKRASIVLSGLFLGMFAGMVWVLFRHYRQQIKLV